MTGSMDPYLYPGTDLLKNLRNIRDSSSLARFEAEATSRRLVEPIHSPLPGWFDTAHLEAIHKRTFQDVYAWAGRFRTVNISKRRAAIRGRLFHRAGVVRSTSEVAPGNRYTRNGSAVVLAARRILPRRNQRSPPVPRGQRPDATGVHPGTGASGRLRHRLESSGRAFKPETAAVWLSLFSPRSRSGYPMKPKSVTGNCARFGKTAGRSAAATPNHLASVAPNWPVEVEGIHAPRAAESSGPPSAMTGKWP